VIRRWLTRWRWPLLLAMLVVAGLAFAFLPPAAAVDAGEISRGPMVVSVTDTAVTASPTLPSPAR